MKLLRVNGGHFVFRIGAREKRMLFQILDLYPLLDPEYHRVSKTDESPKLEASQELLGEVMEEQRAKLRKQIDIAIRDERWLKQDEEGYRFTLHPHQIDWLLQALNNVRVGAWVRLGCPDEFERRTLNLTSENARYVGALELSAYFQMALLKATEPPPR